MMDRIIESYLKDFVNNFGLTHLDEPAAFEQFVNYCVISRHYPENFDLDDVAVGGAGDLGLDGLGILVNDNLVFSRSDVDYFKKALRRLDVQFILVQAKTSQRFEAAEMGVFVSGARQFFSSMPPTDANDAIREYCDIKEYVFDSSRDMDRSPICRLYYVTTGTWTNEPPLRRQIDQGIEDLMQTGLFSSVEIVPIDCDRLKAIHRELHHKIDREMVFEKHSILPRIEGVKEAYLGIVPCLEYLKLIVDGDGSLNRRLFYDNVRDFQGHNAVNSEIEGTVQDSTKNDRFVLLNNGVTIVARDANKVGATFRLKDYQIVNGCQTSHILYLNKAHLKPNVHLPIKVIVTEDSEVTNQIIQGTNRQTEVKLEAFESLTPFQKKLEEFYLALAREGTEPLHYERRSKQYDHLGLRNDRLVTLTTQVKSFVAMFLDEPHSTHRYYGELLASYRGRIFGETHAPIPYFVSGTALCKVEQLFAQGRLPRAWKPRKYQLLMVFRIQNQPFELPPFNSRDIDKYCQALLDVLDDAPRTEEAFRLAGELVDELRPTVSSSREPPERTKVFTSTLIEAATRQRKQSATAARLMGTVKWFSDTRGYGFIVGDDGSEFFVHFTGIVGQGFRSLEEGKRVRFSAADTPRGRQAVDVEDL